MLQSAMLTLLGFELQAWAGQKSVRANIWYMRSADDILHKCSQSGAVNLDCMASLKLSNLVDFQETHCQAARTFIEHIGLPKRQESTRLAIAKSILGITTCS